MILGGSRLPRFEILLRDPDLHCVILRHGPHCGHTGMRQVNRLPVTRRARDLPLARRAPPRVRSDPRVGSIAPRRRPELRLPCPGGESGVVSVEAPSTTFQRPRMHPFSGRWRDFLDEPPRVPRSLGWKLGITYQNLDHKSDLVCVVLSLWGWPEPHATSPRLDRADANRPRPRAPTPSAPTRTAHSRACARSRSGPHFNPVIARNEQVCS